MRPVENAALIQRWVEESGVRGYFDTPHLVFQAYSFEKGSTSLPPMSPWTSCCFVSGVPSRSMVFGMTEAFPHWPGPQPGHSRGRGVWQRGKSPFFSQAKTNALCLALSTREYSEQLHRDLRFLHCLLRFYGEKLERFSTQSVTGTTVEQRVLQYLEKGDAPAELMGMESATLQLRCSPPAVAAGAEKLCLQGKIEKVGKGRYRLAADGKSH